jgi:putative transposase
MYGNRKSIRLKNYNYTQQGAYYITICASKRVCRGGSRTSLDIHHNTFGHIKNGKMILNDIGKIIHDSWLWLADQYAYVGLDKFIIMPNHMHGVILLMDTMGMVIKVKGASRGAPTSRMLHKPLGQLIGAFKTVSTKKINAIRNTSGVRLWQRDFYEHVISDESDFSRIREYIINNPKNWENDKYYQKMY